MLHRIACMPDYRRCTRHRPSLFCQAEQSRLQAVDDVKPKGVTQEELKVDPAKVVNQKISTVAQVSLKDVLTKVRLATGCYCVMSLWPVLKGTDTHTTEHRE